MYTQLCFSMCGLITVWDEIVWKIVLVITYICKTLLMAMFDLKFKCVEH